MKLVLAVESYDMFDMNYITNLLRIDHVVFLAKFQIATQVSDFVVYISDHIIRALHD